MSISEKIITDFVLTIATLKLHCLIIPNGRQLKYLICLFGKLDIYSDKST